MGQDTIPARSSGQTIISEFFNTLRSVLNETQVPRNSSGVATDQGGDLGTTAIRFGDAYIKKVILNTIGSAMTLSEDGTSFRFDAATGKDYSFYINSVLKGFIDSNGIDGAGLKDLSAPFSSTEARVDGGATSALGQVGVGASTGAATTASTTWVDAGTSVSQVTNGGTILITLESASSSAHLSATNTGGTTATAQFRFMRDAVPLNVSDVGTFATSVVGVSCVVPPGSLVQYDQPGAGTYVYKLQYQVLTGTAVAATNVRIRVVEL